MDTQMHDAMALRRRFLQLFVRGMNTVRRERADYQGQSSYFFFLFASLPLLIVVLAIIFTQIGVEVGNLIGLLILIVYACLYTYSLISLIVLDIFETNQCIREIILNEPQMQEALRMTAKLQWADVG